MKDTAKLAKINDVLLHTHLAETEDENNFCMRQYGMRPLDYLEHCNWLGNKTWLAHGIHFNQQEIKRLGAANVGIAHCPTSNMLLASGICPTVELEVAGCNIGLAVDGSASNDCSNMIQEVRQSLLQQRLRYGAEVITAERVLGFATVGSAAVLQRPKIGNFNIGMQADLAVFSLDDLRFSGVGSPLDGLITCGAYQVDKLMVAGKWIVENAEHHRIQSRHLMEKHQILAKKLHKQAFV